MSLQANKKSIIAFITGALAVGCVMVFSFGGSGAFTKQATFLLYFDGSMSGLDDQSLVKYRGVPIGYVQSLKLHYNQLPNDRKIPVFVRVEVERLRRQLNLVADLNDPAVLADQIKAGLRGKLEVDSYVTGHMYVDLSYERDAPKPPTLAFESDIPVIPTLDSNSSRIIERVEAMTRTLGNFDYQGFVTLINSKLDAASEKVAAIPFVEYDQKLLNALAPLASLNTEGWHDRFVATLDKLKHYAEVATVSRGQVIQQSAGLIGLGGTQVGVQTFQANLQALRESLEPQGALRQQINQMLDKTTTLAQTWRQQAENLEQQPALLGR